MSTSYVLLAVLMLVVTYPSRALPLFAPGLERLPTSARSYLRLVGPAVLATLAATNTLVTTTSTGRAMHMGVAAGSVVLCVAVVVWRRNLLLGLAVAATVAALVRTVG